MALMWGGNGGFGMRGNLGMFVGLAVLAIGAYMAYQKDSSFTSVDTGSILMGAGAGILVGHILR